jgi:hypothetical protein
MQTLLLLQQDRLSCICDCPLPTHHPVQAGMWLHSMLACHVSALPAEKCLLLQLLPTILSAAASAAVCSLPRAAGWSCCQLRHG